MSLVAAVVQVPFAVLVLFVHIDHTTGQPVRFGRDTLYHVLAVAPSLVAAGTAAAALLRGATDRGRALAVAALMTACLCIAGTGAAWCADVLCVPAGAVRDAL